MSEGQFTNRHGRSFSEAKVAIDSLPDPVKNDEKPKPVRRKRRQLRLTPLQISILIAIVVIVIAIPLLVGEYVRMNYAGEVTTAKSDLAKVVASVVKKQSTGLTSTDLEMYKSQIASVQDPLCAGGFLDNLANLYPRSKGAYDDCNAYRSKVAVLGATVMEAQAQMVYLEQVQVLLDGVTKPLEEQFAVLSSQQENWQAFVGSLQQLSVPASFSSAHAELVTQASATRDGWIALVQASNAYDSNSFNGSQKKLTATYGAFRTSADVFSSAVATTQSSLQSAVSALR